MFSSNDGQSWHWTLGPGRQQHVHDISAIAASGNSVFVVADPPFLLSSELLVTVRKEGRPRGGHDLLIAATARASDRTTVSVDPGAFADLPGIATVGHR